MDDIHNDPHNVEYMYSPYKYAAIELVIKLRLENTNQDIFSRYTILYIILRWYCAIPVVTTLGVSYVNCDIPPRRGCGGTWVPPPTRL